MVDILSDGFPNPGDAPASSQPLFLQNNNYWPAVLGKDHQIVVGDDSGTTSEGRHTQVGFLNRNGSAPTVNSVGDGVDTVEYSNNGDLYISTSNAPGKKYRLTTTGTLTPIADNAKFGNVPNNGWTFLPGGLILQYGFVAAPGQSGTVTFPIKFPTDFITITFGIQRNSTFGVHQVYVDGTGTNNNTQFAYQFDSTGTQFLYWNAIGY